MHVNFKYDHANSLYIIPNRYTKNLMRSWYISKGQKSIAFYNYQINLKLLSFIYL